MQNLMLNDVPRRGPIEKWRTKVIVRKELFSFIQSVFRTNSGSTDRARTVVIAHMISIEIPRRPIVADSVGQTIQFVVDVPFGRNLVPLDRDYFSVCTFHGMVDDVTTRTGVLIEP